MRAVIDGADDAQLPWAVVDRGCITLLERADPQPAPRAAGEQCSMAAAVSVVVQVAGAAATASPRVTSDAARGAPGAVRRLTCFGPVALTKRKLIHWLLTHDFDELPRRATSHRRFRGPGTTITVPAHGRPELSAKHTGMLIRELEKAGFDRDKIREELGL